MRSPGGLDRGARDREREMAAPLGSVIGAPGRGGATGLAGDRAGGSRALRTLALPGDHAAALASCPAHQSPGPVPPGGRHPFLALGQRRASGWGGLEWDGGVLRLFVLPLAVHAPGAVDGGPSRSVADPDRPARGGRPGGVVRDEDVDRVRVLRREARRVGLAADQDERPGAGESAVAGDSGGHLRRGARGRDGPERAGGAGVGRAARVGPRAPARQPPAPAPLLSARSGADLERSGAGSPPATRALAARALADGPAAPARDHRPVCRLTPASLRHVQSSFLVTRLPRRGARAGTWASSGAMPLRTWRNRAGVFDSSASAACT